MTDLSSLKALKSQADALSQGLSALIDAETPVPNPGTDPGTGNPGTDPGTGPGTDPDPGTDPGPVDPGPTPPTTPPVIGNAVAKDVAAIVQAVKDGKTDIRVRKGALGALLLSGLNPIGQVYITSEDPTDRASFTRIAAAKSSNLFVGGFDVVPTTPNAMDSTPNYLVSGDAASHLIIFSDLQIRGRDDADDFDRWTAADWKAWAWSAVQLSGSGNLVKGCSAQGVQFGFSSIAPGNLFFYSTLDGFSGDSFRLNGDGSGARYCTIQNCIVIDVGAAGPKDDNHPDAFQSFGKYNAATKTYADLSDVIIEKNKVIEWNRPTISPLRGKLQGVGMYNGRLIRAIVRDNEFDLTAYTGMTLGNGQACEVTGNKWRHLDKNPSADFPRVKIGGTGNIVRNNQAPKFLTPVDATNVAAPF